MKTNQVYRAAIVGVLWLCVGAGCRKDPPEPVSCSDGTCCMGDMRPYDYVETIANAPADLYGKTLIFKSPLPAGNDPRWYNTTTGARLQATALGTCSLSDSKVAGLKWTYPLDGSQGPYRYRVWGKVYHDRDAQPIVPVPVLYIAIDRIEEVK